MIKTTRYNLLVKIVFRVLEMYISIALVNEQSQTPVSVSYTHLQVEITAAGKFTGGQRIVDTVSCGRRCCLC